MNEDMLQGKWLHLKNDARERWTKLTTDDIDGIDGSAEEVLNKLQERYGYSREKAQEELIKFLLAERKYKQASDR